MRVLPFDLYVITDPAAPRGLAPYREALAARVGGWALAVRDHDADEATIDTTVRQLASDEVPILLAVADAPRLETAARLGVGVQLAERGPSAQLARSCIDPSRVIAASIHDRAGLARRVADGVDLVLLAPFGDVPGKGAPLSDDEVLGITEASVVPVLALGAIRSRLDVDRALTLGCAGVAVRAFLGNAVDGGAAIATLRGWVDACRRERDLARRSR